MNLKEIQGEYDAVFSLGHLCLTALQLRKMNKRPYAGPFDWVGTSSLPDLCRLIRNRFEGFMNPINLRVTGYSTGVATKDPLSRLRMIITALTRHTILKRIEIHSTTWLLIMK